jgi:hypothetical protein
MSCPALCAEVSGADITGDCATDRLGIHSAPEQAACASCKPSTAEHAEAAQGGTLRQLPDVMKPPDRVPLLQTAPCSAWGLGHWKDGEVRLDVSSCHMSSKSQAAMPYSACSALEDIASVSRRRRCYTVKGAQTVMPAERSLVQSARAARQPVFAVGSSAQDQKALGSRKDLHPRSVDARVKMPTARERRALREVLVQKKLPEWSEDTRRQHSSHMSLSSRMERIRRDIEHCKEGLRLPKHAQVQVDEDVPEWERWQSTFLLPGKTFQKTRHVVRR